MSKQRKPKPYWEMTAKERAEATAEFDEEFVADRFETLTPEMRARWETAKRKSARDKNGGKKNGKAQVISIRGAKELLARSDALAKKLGISRSDLISRGLKAVLAAGGEL